jgi:hypothetical protein
VDATGGYRSVRRPPTGAPLDAAPFEATAGTVACRVMSLRSQKAEMDTDRLFNSAVNFGLNFGLAYGTVRLLRDHRTGVRAGVGAGAFAAAVSWVLWSRYEEAVAAAGGEEVAVPVEEPPATA